MADRYWVGGTGTWNSSTTTNWSATSGGSGGASVPTAADDVFFDGSSGSGIVTTSGTIVAKSINCTDYTGTLTGNATLTVSGSITLVSGMTHTYNGALTINGTGTITSAGKTLSNSMIVNGVGITVDLADAIRVTANLDITNGTFTTNNFNITSGVFRAIGSTARTINLGSSTVTITLSTTNSFASTNLTFNAGTSLIIFTNSSANLSGGGLTFYDVSFTNTTANFNKTISGTNTFNNLSVTGPSTAGSSILRFSDRQTINGALTTTGTAGNRRVWFQSTAYGLSQVLVVNSTANLTDADFRDIIVTGTAAPISGTRVGNLGGCSGITFSTPKTVYRKGVGNWSADQWADTSGGTPNTDYIPLAQDIAVIDQNTSSGTITIDGAFLPVGSIDMSARTSALTFSIGSTLTIYGNLTLGSGITISGSGTATFSGRNTQTITSVGKSFSCPITVDSFGGSVELADALNVANSLQILNGTFNSKGFNISITGSGNFNSSNSNPRTINLTSSTVTIATNFTLFTSDNLNFIANDSTIIFISSTPTLSASGLQFNNISFTATSGGTTFNIAVGAALTGNIFNNITVTGPTGSIAPQSITFAANTIINGTFECNAAAPNRRIVIRSNSIGIRRTITVNSLIANNCDFRDIEIAGAAIGTSLIGIGDCGNNIGLIFPAPKTVYWNLAGSNNWGTNGWAATSGGTPDLSNFPLAQDTAIIDDASNGTSLTGGIAFNVGTLNAAARTTAFNLSIVLTVIYKDLLLGSGITMGSSGSSLTFSGTSISTITSNGVTINQPININATGSVQLADELIIDSTRTLTLDQGTFDAVSFNVTVGLFVSNATNTRELLMGSGLWSLTGTGTVWNISSTNLTFRPQTANIILTNTSTTARTFAGGGLYYNKLTIGGTTGTSTTTISGINTFGELASTKTVAHTIALAANQTYGAWTVTGTAGNVVTLTGTGTNHAIVGAATSGIDYLAMGSIGFAATSPGEFYAGPNSTGTAGAPVYRTAKPADSTRYWVGGTGNWSDTARWSTSSGGSGGASVPRSHDDVVFDSASNATAYTATVNTVTGGIRCKALTIAGPASGNLTLAGTASFVGIHGDVTLPMTGLTRTFTGSFTLSGSTTGRTFTTNGVDLGSNIDINGIGCEWSLGSALSSISGFFRLFNGTLNSAGYNVTIAGFTASETSTSLILGSSSCIFTGNSPFSHSIGSTGRSLLFTFDAGTSSITHAGTGMTQDWNTPITFYDVTFSSTIVSSHTLINANATYNNLTIAARSGAGISRLLLRGDITVNGTLTFTAPTDAIRRYLVTSSSIGVSRTITCAAFAATSDIDFRDIIVTGAAAPISGTRFGDCKGNSGITFDAGTTKYWNLAVGGNWQAAAWALSSGGTPDINNFPLAQDTAIIENTGLNSGATITIGTEFNICTIDMSSRTTAMTFANTVSSYTIYGNLTLGSGTAVTGFSTIIFSGRTTQTLTTAGNILPILLTIDSPGGSLVLQDALTLSANSTFAFNLQEGTFDTNSYNVSLTGATSNVKLDSGTRIKTLILGSETWTLAGGGIAWGAPTTNLTISGTRTGTINFTSASEKTFQGGGADYGNITINQGGAGTLTITGNNTFKDLTATQTATSAAAIALGTTIQKLAQFSGSGQAGNLLTIASTSAISAATLIFTGIGVATTAAVDYLTLIGVRAFPLFNTWYAGNNSITTSTGTLGWIYAEYVPPIEITSGNFLMFAMP